jgi:hypothetical protein
LIWGDIGTGESRQNSGDSREDNHEASDTEELREQPPAPVGGIVPVSGEALNSVIGNQLPLATGGLRLEANTTKLGRFAV